MAAKMATIVGDVTGLPQCHYPYNIPHLVKKIKGFPLKVKSFRNTATYQKLRGGVPSTPQPPFLYHGGGMTLRVRQRVKDFLFKFSPNICLELLAAQWLNHCAFMLL